MSKSQLKWYMVSEPRRMESTEIEAYNPHNAALRYAKSHNVQFGDTITVHLDEEVRTYYAYGYHKGYRKHIKVGKAA